MEFETLKDILNAFKAPDGYGEPCQLGELVAEQLREQYGNPDFLLEWEIPTHFMGPLLPVRALENYSLIVWEVRRHAIRYLECEAIGQQNRTDHLAEKHNPDFNLATFTGDLIKLWAVVVH